MLELAILGLLKEQAMHGYEIKKQLHQKLGPFWRVSYGSLYPTLKRLERRGAIASDPPRDVPSKRRNVYTITEQGEGEFLELIDEGAHSAWEEEKFPLRMAFFRYLSPAMRIRLLERRKSFLVGKLADLKASLADSRSSTDNYTTALLKHGADATANDIEWLDDLLAVERKQVADRPGAADVVPEVPKPIVEVTETDDALKRGATA